MLCEPVRVRLRMYGFTRADCVGVIEALMG